MQVQQVIESYLGWSTFMMLARYQSPCFHPAEEWSCLSEVIANLARSQGLNKLKLLSGTWQQSGIFKRASCFVLWCLGSGGF